MNTDVVGSAVAGSDTFLRTLRGYLASVGAALGVGLESCALDIDTPVSAYLALDHKVAALPDRDVALLWDEQHGWSLAAETRSGEDMVILSWMDADTVTPPADLVVRFVEEFCAGETQPPDAPVPSVAKDSVA